MPGNLRQYGPIVRLLLAGARHIGRMTSVLIPATASSAPRLPPSAALARQARACRLNSGDESVETTVGGCRHDRRSLLRSHLWVMAVLLPFGSAAAHSEPDATGRMGLTSRATVQISLSVAPKLEVSRSAVVAAASGGGAAGTESLCVWSNSRVGSYSISASDASDRSVGEPVGDPFPFEVQLAGARAGAMPLSLAPGVSATGLTPGSEGGCRSGRLIIRPAKMASGAAPVRSGALLLVIAPD